MIEANTVKFKKKNPIAYKIIINMVFLAMSVVTLFPMFTLVITSLKTDSQIILDPLGYIPNPISADAFASVFRDFPIWTYLKNTIFLAVTNVIGVTLTSAMGAYAFARFDVVHKKYIFGAMLAMMMVPGTVLQIPVYELFVSLGWINTYNPFIIPAFLGGGIINVFLIRQFFLSLPKSLFEAAQIDGANELKIFFSLAVPLSKAILITVAIFTFTGVWNDFFSPLLYLTDQKKYTLGYGLYLFYGESKIGPNRAWNIISASNLLVAMPMIVMFFFAQKYFVEGITLTGIKS